MVLRSMLPVALLPALLLAAATPVAAQHVVATRATCDRKASAGPIVESIEPFKANYFVSTWSTAPRGAQLDAKQAKEVEFQFSFRYTMQQLQADTWFPIYFGYTQHSFWQIYDSGNSRPFRESNYNPELHWDPGATWLCEAPLQFVVGYEHVSNGRSDAGNLSRSLWRWYAVPALTLIEWRIALKGMAYIPKTITENPDIEDYLGQVDLLIDYPYTTRDRLVAGRDWTMSLMLRNGSAVGISGQVDLSIQLAALNRLSAFDWIIRDTVNPGLYLLLHSYSGYGESLIDYRQPVRTTGIGLVLR